MGAVVCVHFPVLRVDSHYRFLGLGEGGIVGPVDSAYPYDPSGRYWISRPDLALENTWRVECLVHKLMALYGSAGLQDAHSLSVTYLEHLARCSYPTLERFVNSLSLELSSVRLRPDNNPEVRMTT